MAADPGGAEAPAPVLPELRRPGRDQPHLTIPSVDRLIGYLLGGATADPLARELGEWLTTSPRYRRFTEAHRDTVRKKLRGATDAEAALDVRAELWVARRLLAVRRLGVEWEASGSLGGPDFRVLHRSRHSFNLEVTRLRRATATLAHGGPMLSKLRQLPPSVPNALFVMIGEGPGFDPRTVARSLLARAEVEDDAYFIRRGFRGRREFHERFRRLGAVIVGVQASAPPDVWINPAARIPVPGDALAAAVEALGA